MRWRAWPGGMVAVGLLLLAAPVLLGVMAWGIGDHTHAGGGSGGNLLEATRLFTPSELQVGTTAPNMLAFVTNGQLRWVVGIDGHISPDLNTAYDIGTPAFSTRNSYTRAVVYPGLTLGGLTPPTNGTVLYCTDCLYNSNPCAAASTGALAKRINGAWRCD